MTHPGRRWLEIAAAVTPADSDAESLLAEGLIELGGRAVEQRDGAWVTHLAEPDDPDATLREVEERLSGWVGAEGRVTVEWRWQAHEDWAESWKKGLDVRRVTSRLVVAPSWLTVEPREGDIVLVLDPGMAFGNAEHGTTRGCLRILDRRVRQGDRILDVGAGSGILAIAAARLGAEDVLAVEGDPLAEEALEDNIDRNGARERVRTRIGWVDADFLAGTGRHDGVVANIEGGRLRPLLTGLAAAVRPGGWLLLSGILADEEEALRADVETLGFMAGEVDADGEWCSRVFHRPDGDQDRTDASA